MKYSSKKKLLMLFLLIAVLIMGIGYASINPITGEINGTAIANVQNGVFITDVEYVSDIEANLSNSRIDNFLGTMLKSTVELSNTNPSSEIKYKVTVHNNSTETMLFVGVVYDEDFYDNVEITFEINEGFDVGETKDIYITYKYKETSTVTENNVLKSYLNFKMSKPNRMITAENVGETELYLTSSVVKNKIESIKFEKGTELTDSTKIIARFDASEKQDESIIGYYTDIDNNGLYELTFLSEENIYANQNAQYLFQSLTKLKDIQFENFSTFGVKRMENLFNNYSSLQQLDLSNFDTSQVTNMKYMFFGCIGLTDLNVSKLDTKQVTDMSYMFQNCSNITNLNVSGFDTSNTTNMAGMFMGCSSVESLDLKGFDTGKVNNMLSMFQNCTNLANLDVSKFNTKKVTNIAGMFRSCSSLEKLDVKGFDTSQVERMESMFEYCTGLIDLDVSGFDTSKVINTNGMFRNCKSLTTLNLKGFNTSKVEDMLAMFYMCNELTTIYVNEYNSITDKGWTTSTVTNSSSMFGNCLKLVGGNGTKYNGRYIDASYARIDKKDKPGYFTEMIEE